MPNSLADRLSVYLVADPNQTPRDIVEVARSALAGGVTAIQLRAKSLSDRDSLALARRIASMCVQFDALFLMNDRVDLALAVEADGVHLGVDDLPLDVARDLLGPDAVIGYSPETDEQAAGARSLGADYLGVGPVFLTASKSDAGDAIGTDNLTRRIQLSGLPTVGIGGITVQTAPHVIQAGAVGVAVIGAILRADDPQTAAAHLRDAVNGAKR